MRQINLENNNGSIRLKFQVAGKRFSLSPVKGGKFDNEFDQKRARAIAEIIRSDIESGNFDPTLEKYKPQSTIAIKKNLEKAKQQLEEAEANKKQKPDLKDLWKQYSDFKKPHLSPSTYKVDFESRVGKCLEILPCTDLSYAVDIREWLINNKPVPTVKKILTQFSACCDWAVSSGLLDVNPFSSQAKQIKLPKKSEEDDINPFTADERDRIIKAFEDSQYYSHYVNFVKFLFFTGCRPNEVIALTWGDVRQNKLTFNKGYVYGNLKKGLKTQQRRTIELNHQVREILENQSGDRDSKKLIFPSPKGKNIDWHNFSNKAWRAILKNLPDIEYRNPYQTRHTFITLALLAGVSYPDVAKHCGNSPEIILARYQGVTRNFVMPEI